MVFAAQDGPRLVVCILLVVSLSATFPTTSAQSDDIANVAFEAQVPAPVHQLAASSDGAHVAVVDDQGRFTFIGDAGGSTESWTPPRAGTLSILDPSLGEVAPRPVGITVTPTGEHWAGAVAYEKEHPGKVFGFARWSDAPVWTFNLQGPSGAASQADQPTVLTSGGPYHGVGTAEGKVYLLKAAHTGQTQNAYRTYDSSNSGSPFGSIGALALSADGKTILIGTDDSDKPSLHVFTDTFFKGTFKRIDQPVSHVALSDDGLYGVAVTGEGPNTRIHFLDIDNNTVLWETGTGGSVTAIDLDADGDVLVVGQGGGHLAIFEHTGGIDDRTAKRSHQLGSKVTGVSIDATGLAISASTEEGLGYLLTREGTKPLWYHDAERPLVGTTLSSDGEVLVFAARGDDGRVIYTEAEHDVEHVTAPQPKARPGEENAIALDVANNGNRVEVLTAHWTQVPDGWKSEDATQQLLPGGAGRLAPTLTPPSGKAPGQYDARLVLQHGGGEIPIPLKITVPEITSGRTTLAWSIDAAVPGGAPAGFVFVLENTGNTPNLVKVGYAEVPDGWKAEFVGTKEFRMQPGATRDVILKVYAPHDAPMDREAWFDMIVAWQHGEERIPITLQLLDEQLYRDRLTRSTDNGGTSDSTELVRERLIEELGDVELGAAKRDKKLSKSESKDSPAGGVLLSASVLVGLAAWMRRRA